MKTKNVIISILFILSLCGMIFFGWRALQQDSPQVQTTEILQLKEGEQFPTVDLLDLSGEVVSSSILSDGKPMLFMEWASWCPDCQSQLPIIQELYQEYGDKVSFVLSNLSDERDPREQAERYIQEKGYSFPYYFDQDGKVKDQLGISSIPTSYLIDKDGKVVEIFDVVTAKEDFEAVFKKL